MTDESTSADVAPFLCGGGELGALTRALAWSATPVGPVAGWPRSLKTVVAMVLAAPHPMFLWWGPDCVQFYNDAYRRYLGADRHPAALGASGRTFWAEIWPTIGPQIEAVMRDGTPTRHEDRSVPIIRDERIEEVFWTYGYSPVRGDDDEIAGTLVVCQDSTHRVVEERRRQVRSRLAARTPNVTTEQQCWSYAASVLAGSAHDVPFALCYAVATDGSEATLVARAGDVDGEVERDPLRPGETAWPVAEVLATGRGVVVDDVGRRLGGEIVLPPWPEPVERAWVAPVGMRGDAPLPYGVVVLGISPRRPLDAAYRDFLSAVAGEIGANLSRVRAKAEEERSAAALADAYERFRRVFDEAPVAVAVLSGAAHRFVVANPHFLAMTNREALVGSSFAEAFPELVGTELHAIMDAVYETGEPFVAHEFRAALRPHPGAEVTERYYRFNVVAMEDAEGAVDGLIAVAVDVTELVRARRAVEAGHDRMMFALDAAGVGYWALDLTTFEAERSLRHDQIFGYAERAPHWTLPMFLEHVVAADRAAVEEAFAAALSNGTDFRIQCRVRGIDGVVRWIEAIGRTERDDGGLPGRMLGVVRDDSERHELLIREREARAQAERASRAKDEFLAMLGHELRNPLAPILTALQLMRLKGVEAAPRERAVIERQTRHMVTLVDDLLDVSRFTRGKVALKRQRCDVADIVERAIEIARPLFDQLGHGLAVDAPGGELMVDGDPERLAQVVSNLLTNAAKYTEPGGEVALRAFRGEDGAIVVEVRDSGIGIAPEMLPRIFDLFAQEAQAIDRARGGLGLGLAIVRSLVRLHGGTVSASSEGLGHGSTFVIRLPGADTEGAPAPARAERITGPVRSMRTGVRVLVVDDNEDAATLVKDALVALGHDVEVAHDANAGLEAARRVGPHVAVVDIGLPGMDGYELARRLREEAGLADVRIIALTGYGQSGDHARSEDEGFEAHLVKPVDVAELHERIVGAEPEAAAPRTVD